MVRMMVVVLVILTVILMLMGRAHLAFVLIMRTAGRLPGGFLIVFFVAQGAALGRFLIKRMMVPFHTSVPFICVVFWNPEATHPSSARSRFSSRSKLDETCPPKWRIQFTRG